MLPNGPVDTQGRHLLVELYGCDPHALDDAERLAGLLRRAAEAAGSRVVAEVFHPFAPHGITGVVVIEESHLSVHTWPVTGYAAVDNFDWPPISARMSAARSWKATTAAPSPFVLLMPPLG